MFKIIIMELNKEGEAGHVWLWDPKPNTLDIYPWMVFSSAAAVAAAVAAILFLLFVSLRI